MHALLHLQNSVYKKWTHSDCDDDMDGNGRMMIVSRKLAAHFVLS